MLPLTFNKPERIEIDTHLPIAYANQSFPYESLSSARRFEELLYCIAEANLGEGIFEDYDEVSLMSGVSDQGRDCTLLKNGGINGVIQCKKYNSNLSKDEFGKEITKFVLYSLIDRRLIPNPSSFTYYMAVSKGFVRECSDFIDGFKRQIVTEPKLADWINYNMKQFISLNSLVLNDVMNDVKRILAGINVRKILPTTIDTYLESLKGQTLINSFFSIKTVVDVEEIAKLRRDLELPSNFNEEKLVKYLQRSSISLRAEKNQFSEIIGSHIDREETESLYQWINDDLKIDEQGKAQNVCLLVGNAGMGKTVILKDLYDKLVSKNIPVLGLKADKLVCSSVKELQDKIGIPISVYDFIDECKRLFKTVVILVDQIDALSQSMSSNRSYLQVFKDLIDQHRYDSNIRIVISVRIFDLQYDPSLKLFRNIFTVQVSSLKSDDVLEQLKKIGVSKEMISPKLFEVLRVPNHLDVFGIIYKGNSNTLGVSTIQDMYYELWKQKNQKWSLNHPHVKTSVKKLVYSIAEKMFLSQNITVNKFQYEDYEEELSFLESERLIKREGNNLQFFHQTFYDFVYAKQFVENNGELISYIKNNGQALRLRSLAKMILSYLRDFDLKIYLKVIGAILEDEEILYHIKYLAFSIILYIEEPTESEKRIVFDSACKCTHLKIVLFEQAQTEEWFEWVIKNEFFEGILLNQNVEAETKINDYEANILRKASISFLRNAVYKCYPESLNIAAKLTDKSILQNILQSVSNWNIPLAYELLESCTEFEIIDPYGYYHVLENVAKVNPSYALKIITMTLKSHHERGNTMNDYFEKGVLKTLAKNCPQKLIEILFEAIKEDFGNLSNPTFLERNYFFDQVWLNDNETQVGKEYLYQLLGLCLRSACHSKSLEFYDFFEKYHNKAHEPIQRLLLFALEDNVNIGIESIFRILVFLIQDEELSYDSSLSHDARRLFRKAFSHFSLAQRSEILTIIMALERKSEVYYLKLEKSRKVLRSQWGITKYSWLRSVPFKIISRSRAAIRELHELQRRHPGYKETVQSRRTMAGIVGRPLPERAYTYMGIKQWLSSCKKYDGSQDRWSHHFLKGDIEEHSSALKEFIASSSPENGLSLLSALAKDETIRMRYLVKALWGWSSSEKNIEIILPYFTQILADREIKNDIVYECLFIAKDFVRNNVLDPIIIKFLVNVALDYTDEIAIDEMERETSIQGLVTKGMNTKPGHALEALVLVEDPSYGQQIFSIVEDAMLSRNSAIRSLLVFRFAYLMRIDENIAYRIFINGLTIENNVHVLASALWSMQYMGNYDFAGLLPIYEKLVRSSVVGKEDSHMLFSILYYSLLRGKEGAESLLETLIECNRYISNWAINDIMKCYNEFSSFKLKNNALLDKLLERASEEEYESLRWSFTDCFDIALIDIESYLKKYVCSKYFKLSDSFTEYLTYQSRTYPLEAIEVFDLALKSNKHSQGYYGGERTSEAVTKFIVSAWDSLILNDEATKLLKFKLMTLFDKILKDYRFNKFAECVLESLV